MKRTTYHIDKMDCAAEEQLVRMRLADLDGIERLAFDLPARRLDVFHTGARAPITAALDGLGLGSREIEHADAPSESEGVPEKRGPLMAALAINAVFFAGEFVAGLLAGSMGLVADSLDMLADAVVYALSLAAVGGAVSRKRRVARWSGYFQFGLATLGLVEVGRRFLGAGEVPDFTTMMVVAALALAGNVVTLLILRRARSGEAHIEASWIFTSNDIKVNALVIASGGLVWATASKLPDLIAGGLIFLIVANGARRILALAQD
jgi:Co/Zn/Cd efflux system component